MRRVACRSMRLHFGLGAWSNKHFEHTLYPLRMPHAERLGRYASVFGCAELARLYHVPVEEEPIETWTSQVPAGFRFLPKMHKSLVVDGPRVDAARAWRMQLSRFGGHMGIPLAQFPPAWKYSETGLDELGQLLALGPAAVEFRHPSWFRPDVEAMLRRHGAPLVWGTHPRAPAPAWVTGDVGYVRFVGRHFESRGRHVTQEDRLMDVLAMRERLAAAPWRDCFVIVTNAFEGNAIDSLPRIAAALGETALARRVTRAPGGVLFPDAVATGALRP